MAASVQEAASEEPNHSLDDGVVCLRREYASMARNDGGVGREELPGPSVAAAVEAARRERRCRDVESVRVSVRIAGDLAEDPVGVSARREDDRRPELRAGEVGKGKPDDDYDAGCRYDHASSSSGRCQSVPSAASLRRVVSDGISSGATVTRTREPAGRLSGSTGRMLPSGSTSAWIIRCTVRVYRKAVDVDQPRSATFAAAEASSPFGSPPYP